RRHKSPTGEQEVRRTSREEAPALVSSRDLEYQLSRYFSKPVPLTPGLKLAQYEVVAPIGAGGMGEVYRARDTRLARDVAIKVVSDGGSRDPARLARFQSEAQLLAALNHPHIATIHGLEEAAGTQFLVMELVEGETLAERLKSGPIPVNEALGIARQIADALQAAHE